MPYAVMCTANGPTARNILWGSMLLRRATHPCAGAFLAAPDGIGA